MDKINNVINEREEIKRAGANGLRRLDKMMSLLRENNPIK
jgi:hypothetical protein